MKGKPVQQPTTIRELVHVYDYIYRSGDVRHHIKGLMGPYGSHTNRDPVFLRWIAENVKPESIILDASCGRGHLARSLRREGHKLDVTEISPWLCENELKGLDPKQLTYDRLDELGQDCYDVVISQDVLEHLLDEEGVLQALKSFASLSRRFICISVGLKRGGARKYPAALGMTHIHTLHIFCPGINWWKKVLPEYLDFESPHFYWDRNPSNLFCFSEKKT